jgi:hypothetical protein
MISTSIPNRYPGILRGPRLRNFRATLLPSRALQHLQPLRQPALESRCAAPVLQPLPSLRERPVAEFCPFVDIASLAMRPHSETLPLPTAQMTPHPIRYLIYSQALTRKMLHASTGHVLAMKNSGDTAENLRRVLPGMRHGSFTDVWPGPLHRGFAFSARLENSTRSN